MLTLFDKRSTLLESNTIFAEVVYLDSYSANFRHFFHTTAKLSSTAEN